MADWGAFIRSTDGSLLVTPDTPCYELIGEYAPSSRSGNTNTYYVPSSSYPLIFIRCGEGQSAGILSISAANPGYTVQVLSTVSCNILAFRVIEGSESGYGMATYASDGDLVFASSRNVLNVRNAGSISEGASFASTPGVDMVSYTCGPVLPSSSTSERWEYVDFFVNFETSCTFETVCRDELQCGFVRRCNLVYVYPNFVEQCSDVYECNWVNVCRPEWVCRTFPINNFVYARVRRTNWSIQRGTARINNGSVSFQWVTHLSGFYDTVIGYSVFQLVGTPIGGSAPFFPYIPNPVWYDQNVRFEGQLNENNTFPYTTSRANEISLACLTAIRSNHD